MTQPPSAAAPDQHKLSRRRFLQTSARTAALLAAVKTSFLGGAHIAEAAGPERLAAWRQAAGEIRLSRDLMPQRSGQPGPS